MMTLPMTLATFTPRILVVEDNASLSRLYCKTLQHEGYTVHPALTLEEADNILKADTRFDIVLCDMQIGAETSIKFLRQHRATFAEYGTELIIITGQRHYLAVAEDLNIEFVLEKPVTIRTLVMLVARLAKAYSK